MFRNRKTSKKPSDEFHKAFRMNFPQLRPLGTTEPSHFTSTSLMGMEVPNLGENRRSASPDLTTARQHGNIPTLAAAITIVSHLEQAEGAGQMPQALNESCDATESCSNSFMTDLNGQASRNFVDLTDTNKTSISGNAKSLYQSWANDFHALEFSVDLETPVMMQSSGSILSFDHSTAPFSGILPRFLQHPKQRPTHTTDQFGVQQEMSLFPCQSTSPPVFKLTDDPMQVPPVENIDVDIDTHDGRHSPQMLLPSQSLFTTMQPLSGYGSREKFRFLVALHAQTAMIHHADETPVTYLNKSQVYKLSVFDKHRQVRVGAMRYRTFIRVSFENELQRQKCSACWQLWKSGRGVNEAHERGGRLQAVEYIKSGQNGAIEDSFIDLESASLDGFCVTWTPSARSSECHISVRFNFLSTDFSHSKGVKGIPLRLCAKTEIMDNVNGSTQLSQAEICYCRVKLFRDHGAERKLTNDVAYIKKAIGKLEQQVAEIEPGTQYQWTKTRTGSIAKDRNLNGRSGKVPKYQRIASLSDTSNDDRGSAEESLQVKLAKLKNMLVSTRSASVLNLQGASEDDPDLFPVNLSVEMEEIASTGSSARMARKRESARSWKGQDLSLVPRVSNTKCADGNGHDYNCRTYLQQPTDRTCKPAKRKVEPVACFFVQPHITDRTPDDNFYRAIYLYRRTLNDFVLAVATACDIELCEVLHTIRVNRNGLQILLDDQYIQELAEGQAMKAEFCVKQSDRSSMQVCEWNAGATAAKCDGALATVQNTKFIGYELRLLF